MGGRWGGIALVLGGVLLLADAAQAERQVKTAARPKAEGEADAGKKRPAEKGAAEKGADYQPPERFVERQAPNEYLPYARQFLEDHADHPHAPRILLDMLLVASVQRDQAAIKATKSRLLLEHPLSLPSTYVIKTSQAGELRSLLKEQFIRTDRSLDRHTFAQFARALEVCLREYGGSFADDDIWVMTALAVDMPAVAQRCRQQLKKPEGDAGRTIDIRLDTQLTARHRFLSLQPSRGYAPARVYQQFLYQEQMTESERNETDVRAVVIENLLHDRRFAEARTMLAEVCRLTRQPRLDFWYAWAQAAQDDRAGAQRTLQRLQREFPQSTWSDAASQLATRLDQFDDALSEQAKVVEGALDILQRSPPERLEMTIEYGAAPTGAPPHDGPNGPPRPPTDQPGPKQIYLNLDLPDDSFELVARAGTKSLFAYQAGADGTRLHLGGDSKVRRFAGRGLCPLLTFAAPNSPTGQLNLQFSFNTVPQGSGGLLQSARNLLAMPLLATPATRHELLRQIVRLGVFPERPRTDGTETVLGWVRPEVDKPNLVRHEVRFTSEQRLSSLAWNDAWRVKEIHYGPRNRLTFAPLAWPELPTEAAAEMGAGDFFRMLGAISSLVESK